MSNLRLLAFIFSGGFSSSYTCSTSTCSLSTSTPSLNLRHFEAIPDYGMFQKHSSLAFHLSNLFYVWFLSFSSRLISLGNLLSLIGFLISLTSFLTSFCLLYSQFYFLLFTYIYFYFSSSLDGSVPFSRVLFRILTRTILVFVSFWLVLIVSNWFCWF